MISKMTSLYKSYLTMAAFVWFLPSMYLDMLCKIRFFVKRLLTTTALMWFFSCVYPHVHYQCTFSCKNLLTVSALVCSIPCVSSYDYNIRSLSAQKPSHNNCTDVVLICVYHHIFCKIIFNCKTFSQCLQ